jgi:hypothetical protein
MSHGCGQELETLIEVLQTLFLRLGEIKMQASDDSCYFSHNYPFEEATSRQWLNTNEFLWCLQC